MIERDTSTNIGGQFELSDLIDGTGNGEQAPEGYDANGALVNPAAEALPVCDEARLTELATEINAITNHARVVLASAAIDIGKRLIEARGIVPHGRWTEWLAANVDYSERKAQQLMQLAEEFGRGQLQEAYSGLGLSQMTALLAAPEDAREGLAEQAKAEALSVRELKAEIARLKAETGDKQMRIDALDRVNGELSATVNANEEEIAEIGKRYDEAMERIRVDAITAENAIEREREAARIAEAKAAAAESSANVLRKLHSDAEDRAAQSAQRASDAVNRANQTAKDLAEARAEIARLREQEPEAKTVEVIPEAVTRELEALRRELAEAKDTSGGNEKAGNAGASAVEKFRWFYSNQMKPAFSTALNLLTEVAREDAHAASTFATALTAGCKKLMEQLGTEG